MLAFLSCCIRFLEHCFSYIISFTRLQLTQKHAAITQEWHFRIYSQLPPPPPTHNKRTHRMTPLSSIKHSHAVYYNHNTCMRVCTIMKSPSVGVFIDTACIICGAGSIKRHGVRPSLSVRQSQHGPTSGLLLWARLQEISIDCCGSGVRIRAVPHCQRT